MMMDIKKLAYDHGANIYGNGEVRFYTLSAFNKFAEAYHQAKCNEEIQTLRAKVEVLVEYKNSVIDHFIVAFHGYDESKSVYDNLSLLIAYYQELALDPKVSKEASDLHAKVASAELLVDALKNSIQFISGSVRIESNSFDEPPSPVSEWDYQADMLALELNEALESYKKLSEVEYD